jgi:hypothetical protein
VKLASLHTCVRRHHDRFEILHRELRDCGFVAGENGFEGFFVLPFRICGRECGNASERKGDLCNDRMFDPQRSVLVESREAFALRYEVGAGGIGRGLYELFDRRLRRPVVPRW